MRGFQAGPIQNPAAAQALASVLITIKVQVPRWHTPHRPAVRSGVSTPQLQLTALPGIPLVAPGDDLAKMNESMTRSAGAVHGQEMTTQELSSLIEACGRLPRQRTTLYGVPADERLAANQPPRRRPPRFVLLPVSEPI